MRFAQCVLPLLLSLWTLYLRQPKPAYSHAESIYIDYWRHNARQSTYQLKLQLVDYWLTCIRLFEVILMPVKNSSVFHCLWEERWDCGLTSVFREASCEQWLYLPLHQHSVTVKIKSHFCAYDNRKRIYLMKGSEPWLLTGSWGTHCVKSKVMTAVDWVRARHGYSHRGWGSASRDSRKSRDCWRDRSIIIFSQNYFFVELGELKQS